MYHNNGVGFFLLGPGEDVYLITKNNSNLFWQLYYDIRPHYANSTARIIDVKNAPIIRTAVEFLIFIIFVMPIFYR